MKHLIKKFPSSKLSKLAKKKLQAVGTASRILEPVGV